LTEVSNDELDKSSFFFSLLIEALLHAQPNEKSYETTNDAHDIKPMSHWFKDMFESPLKRVSDWV
jgi:hypothetical protein